MGHCGEFVYALRTTVQDEAPQEESMIFLPFAGFGYSLWAIGQTIYYSAELQYKQQYFKNHIHIL
jgi:hypothetical protein